MQAHTLHSRSGIMGAGWWYIPKNVKSRAVFTVKVSHMQLGLGGVCLYDILQTAQQVT